MRISVFLSKVFSAASTILCFLDAGGAIVQSAAPQWTHTGWLTAWMCCCSAATAASRLLTFCSMKPPRRLTTFQRPANNNCLGYAPVHRNTMHNKFSAAQQSRTLLTMNYHYPEQDFCWQKFSIPQNLPSSLKHFDHNRTCYSTPFTAGGLSRRRFGNRLMWLFLPQHFPLLSFTCLEGLSSNGMCHLFIAHGHDFFDDSFVHLGVMWNMLTAPFKRVRLTGLSSKCVNVLILRYVNLPHSFKHLKTCWKRNVYSNW